MHTRLALAFAFFALACDQREPGSPDTGLPLDDAGTDGGAPGIDAGLDAGQGDPDAFVPPSSHLSLTFVGGGGATITIDSVDATVHQVCTSDCEVVAPPGAGGFRVSLTATDRTGVFETFSGPCLASDSFFECVVAEGDHTVQAHVRPSGVPSATASSIPGGTDGISFQRAVMDADGNVAILAYVADAILDGREIINRTVLFSVRTTGEVGFARTLGGGSLDVVDLAIDPLTQDVWVATECDGYQTFDDTGDVGLTGPCVAHYSQTGVSLGWHVWEGNGWLSDIAIGIDGTIAVAGGIRADATWDSIMLRRSSGNQFVARVTTSPAIAFASARVLGVGATDLNTDLAVGPDGSIYALGAVRGGGTFGTLDYTDLPNFLYQAYLLRLDASASIVNALRINSTYTTQGDAVIADADGVYLATEYSGQLDIGNPTSREALGISFYACIVRLGTDLSYVWHVDGELWQEIQSLALQPGGGVLATARIESTFSWEEGGWGWVATPTLGSVVSQFDSSGVLQWMTCIGGYGVVRSAGSHVAVAGSYSGALVIAPATASGPRDVYVARIAD